MVKNDTLIKRTELTNYSFAAMICLYKNNIDSEVKTAIESSFFDQTIPPKALYVVQDGPISEDVAQVIEGFKENLNITEIKFDKNQGHGKARAAAVKACNYEWLAVIDSDDISLPNRFESLLTIIHKHQDVSVVGGALYEFEGAPNDENSRVLRQYPTEPELIKKMMRTRCPIAQPTSILKVKDILAVGNYQSWYQNEDYHLWIRIIASDYTIRNTDDPVLLFRTNPDLYKRRSGLKYWYNEVRLQYYSLTKKTTSIGQFAFGACVRFFVQVMLPNSLREQFYKMVLRRS